ncbi:prevent-host-death protein [Photorhabdus luminescens subsp. sonorensis]|uniref:Prevent-host-death protein n=2 Tax=Photorhabdus luminescens TaxID=29488 RepID=A0A5C4RMY1_PHOLU|nr:prevent-host-death protein [Photorhabdus luminescens subsp. sonorensis]
MHEAKSNLSQLAGKPYVQLAPINQQDRVPGGFEDLITIGEDFFDADREIQFMFQGDSSTTQYELISLSPKIY